jgi:hypothetical protein
LLNPDSSGLTLIAQTPVTDGGFEDVTSLYANDATSGGWTLAGPQAAFESNANNAYQTPYGSIFVTFYGEGSVNSVSQSVALSACQSGTYTLSYSYSIPTDSLVFGGSSCTLSVTYGGTTIDSIELSYSDASWNTRTTVFTPVAGSATLSFIWDCSNLIVDELDLLLDNISAS